MNNAPKKLIALVAAALLSGSVFLVAGCSQSASSKSASASVSSASSATSASASASASASSSAAASAASASASISSAASSATSGAVGMANPWHSAATAQEAAAGAGLESFPLPEGAVADMGTPLEVTYQYMDGMAEARYDFGASAVTMRTGKVTGDQSFDISGDYNTYTREWTENIDDVSVACASNREGESKKSYWGDGGIAHSIVAQGLGGDTDFGLNADRLAVFVRAMK